MFVCTSLNRGFQSTDLDVSQIMLGDAVVWWRVWVIWPRSLLVRWTSVILLAATLGMCPCHFSAVRGLGCSLTVDANVVDCAGMGILDTMDSCSKDAFSVLSVFNFTSVPSGSFYQSDFFGLAASVLSLATNMVATILIGCKAWCVTVIHPVFLGR